MLEFGAKMCKQSQTFLCLPSPTDHVEDTGKKKYWNFGNYWSQNGDITENTISTRFRRNRICLNFVPKCANKVRLFLCLPSPTDHVEDTGKKKDWNFGNYWSQNGDITENAISTRFRRNRVCLNFAPKCANKVRLFLCQPSPTDHVEDTGKKKYWNFGNYWSQNGDITQNTISTRFRRNRICLNFVPKCANKVRLFCVRPVQLIMWKTLARKKIEILAIIDLKMAISRKIQFQHDLGEIGYAWILSQNVQTKSDFFVSAQSNWSCGRHWQEKRLKFWQLLISKWRYHGKCNFNTI